MKAILLSLFLLCFAPAYSQIKRVLFIGNSYTYVNDLPHMVVEMSSSAGDALLVDANADGGATFYSHSINTVSLNKIKSGNWDYVVLQGQSLELFGYFTGIPNPFPAAGVLDSIINEYNPCGETMFYRTWGRKNGLGSYSYETMDSLIHVNYMNLADTLDAVVSPVGEVWKYIRQHHPSIELYDADESHPSLAGTYAAACSFYSAIFRKDPLLCSFNSTLNPAEAAQIKSAAKAVVFDRLPEWHIGEYDSLFVGCPGYGGHSARNELWDIYPNPATTTIAFDFVNESGEPILLYNSMGLLVEEIDPDLKSISISHLREGLYFLKMPGEPEARKFIKQ